MIDIVVSNQSNVKTVRLENVVGNQLTKPQRQALELLVQGQSLNGRVHGRTYNRLLALRLIEDSYTITNAGRAALGVDRLDRKTKGEQ